MHIAGVLRAAVAGALVGFAVTTAAPGAHAQSDGGDFYAGKQMKFVIGSSPGGGYDTYGRLFAEFFPRHLPGHPTMVPQNMPGASGIRSANYLYEVAPKDGTVLGTFNQSMPQRQVLDRAGVRFDAARFNWIGAMSRAVTVFMVWHDVGIRTLDDAKKREVLMGALSANGGNAVFPQVVNSQLGTLFKVVTGYVGTSTITLAMERGEVHGLGSMNWDSLMARKPDWVRDHKIDIILQIGMEKEPAIRNVPLLIDLARTPKQRKLFELISADTMMNWPVVAPPGIPADRVARLRAAFDTTMKDPALLKEAKRRGMSINGPSGGAQVQALVTSILDTPDDVVAMYQSSIRKNYTVRCRDFADRSRCAAEKGSKKKKKKKKQ